MTGKKIAVIGGVVFSSCVILAATNTPGKSQFFWSTSAPSGSAQCNVTLEGTIYVNTTAAAPQLTLVDHVGGCNPLVPAATENMRFIPLFHSSNTSGLLITFAPDTAFTVTRIQGQTQGTASTCSVHPTVTIVQSGAPTSTLTVADASTSDSGALTNAYAATTSTTIQYNGGTCTTAPTNMQFIVQYK